MPLCLMHSRRYLISSPVITRNGARSSLAAADDDDGDATEPE